VKNAFLALTALAAGCLGDRPDTQARPVSDAGTRDAGDSSVAAPDSNTGLDAADCRPGADCTPAESCQQMSIDCSSGSPVCKAVRNFDDGTDCGANRFCSAGACKPCGEIQACVPAAEPCHEGAVSCSAQEFGCVDTGLPRRDGADCEDGNPCTQHDTCQAGTCVGGSPVTCSARDECHDVGTCDRATGVCTDPEKPDNEPCETDGLCQAGRCCARGYVSCGGACSHPAFDPHNCGRCGHDCLGGTCYEGQCLPWVVARLVDFAYGLTANAMNVVWLDSSHRVLQQPIRGGDVMELQTIPASRANPARIAMMNGNVVWLSQDSSSRTNVSKAWENFTDRNPAPPTASLGSNASESYYPMGLVLDASGSTAYFALGEKSAGRATIQACTLGAREAPPSCQPIASFAPGQDGAGVALGGGDLFFIDNAAARVVRRRLASSVSSDYATEQAGVAMVSTDATHVYWANQASGSFTIHRGPLASPVSNQPEPVLRATPGSVSALASDGKYVYYVTRFSGTIGYVPVSGGSGQTLATGSENLTDATLALAGGAVYYVHTKAIMGVAAP